jgi:ankyrin repeat protein
LRAIIETVVDIDAQDVGGSTALTIGAWMGQESAVKIPLENGADVNKRDPSGHTALHISAKGGAYNVVRLLIEHDASIDASVYGFTALLFAARNAHFQVVDYLAQIGADVRAEDYNGRTALHWMARYGQIECLRSLLAKGAKINAADHWGRTSLMWAIEWRKMTAAISLLDTGDDVRIKANDQTTALHVAAYVGDPHVTARLLESGADVDAVTQESFTALHIAAFLGNTSVVQVLLERGANIGIEAVCHVTKDSVRVDAGEFQGEKRSRSNFHIEQIDVEDGYATVPYGSYGNTIQLFEPSLIKRFKECLRQNTPMTPGTVKRLTTWQFASLGGSAEVGAVLAPVRRLREPDGGGGADVQAGAESDEQGAA